MKIKLAILEKDRSYLTRLVSAFGTKYADKFEIYSFTDPEVALETVAGARIDVLLAADAFDLELTALPKRCAFAYLVDSAGIETLNDQRAVCKYQKADLIYKQILSIYAEKASSITGFTPQGDKGHVVAFCAAAGGVGSSSMAAACAARLAAMQKKALYLNLEVFGGADMFFGGQGQYDMSDVIFALKSKKTNLPLKLAGSVRQDPCGVYFYAPAKYALDRMELTTEEILRLLSELKLMGEYDYIILDLAFALDRQTLQLLRQAEQIVLVSDGSAVANAKTERAFAALATMEQSSDAPLTSRLSLAYNRVSSKSGHSVNAPGLRVLGGAPRYAGAETRQLVEELAKLDIFDSIL